MKKKRNILLHRLSTQYSIPEHCLSFRLSQNQEIEELTKICDELIAKLGTE